MSHILDELYQKVDEWIEEYDLYLNLIPTPITSKYILIKVTPKIVLVAKPLDVNKVLIKLIKNGKIYTNQKLGFMPNIIDNAYIFMDEQKSLRVTERYFFEYLSFLDKMLNQGEKKDIVKAANITVSETHLLLNKVIDDKKLLINHYPDSIKQPEKLLSGLKYGEIVFNDWKIVYCANTLFKQYLMLVRMYRDEELYYDVDLGFQPGRKIYMDKNEFSRFLILFDDMVVKKELQKEVAESDMDIVEPVEILNGKEEMFPLNNHETTTGFNFDLKHWIRVNRMFRR
jgi:hypothetical protein